MLLRMLVRRGRIVESIRRMVAPSGERSPSTQPAYKRELIPPEAIGPKIDRALWLRDVGAVELYFKRLRRTRRTVSLSEALDGIAGIVGKPSLVMTPDQLRRCALDVAEAFGVEINPED